MSATPGRIWLLRHGQTDWSATGRHTGRTDIPLNEAGRERARGARPLLPADPTLVLSSPLSRARDTAHLAGLAPDALDDDLLEWDYGAWEGRTTPQIRIDLGDQEWTVWSGPVPPGDTPGEQVDDVGRRADRLIARCLPVIANGGEVVLVAHAHLLRILTARWLGLPAVDGRHLTLDPASVSQLAFEHQSRVIARWNLT